MTIEPGQRWISQADGSVVIVDRKSDLLNHWWKVRSSGAHRSISIDETLLLTEYRLDAERAERV